MSQQILIVVFWFLGLIGMPLGVFLYTKAVEINDTNDTQFIRNLITWGMILTGVWFTFGGLVVFLTLATPG